MSNLNRRPKRNNLRRPKGSAIAETGPAFFVLFLLLFFPLLDVISLPIIYYSCVTLNDIQLREAACLPASEATKQNGLIIKEIPDNWKSKGLGMFVNSVGNPQTTVSYADATVDKVEGKIVKVDTTVICRPFMTIPFMPGVPGLSAPVTMRIRTQRQLENPHFANS